MRKDKPTFDIFVIDEDGDAETIVIRKKKKKRKQKKTKYKRLILRDYEPE